MTETEWPPHTREVKHNNKTQDNMFEESRLDGEEAMHLGSESRIGGEDESSDVFYNKV